MSLSPSLVLLATHIASWLLICLLPFYTVGKIYIFNKHDELAYREATAAPSQAFLAISQRLEASQQAFNLLENEARELRMQQNHDQQDLANRNKIHLKMVLGHLFLTKMSLYKQKIQLERTIKQLRERLEPLKAILIKEVSSQIQNTEAQKKKLVISS